MFITTFTTDLKNCRQRVYTRNDTRFERDSVNPESKYRDFVFALYLLSGSHISRGFDASINKRVTLSESGADFTSFETVFAL